MRSGGIGSGATLARKNPTSTCKAGFKPPQPTAKSGNGSNSRSTTRLHRRLRLSLCRLSMQEAQALATVEDVDQLVAYQRKGARL